MAIFEQLVNTFETGNGYWNPLIWVVAFVVIFLIVYILRGMGNSSYKKGTEQGKVFLSGNKEQEKELLHVKSSNLYWGWTESMKWIIDALKSMHTGNASDFILWFVIVMGILFLFVGLI